MSDGKYNGWTNFATWKVNLEVLSDYGDHLSDSGVTFADRYGLVQALRECVDEALTNYGEIDDNSLAVSWAQSFAADCDYYEIADHIIADFPQVLESNHHECDYCSEVFYEEDELFEHTRREHEAEDDEGEG